jgi:hypothetical protein
MITVAVMGERDHRLGELMQQRSRDLTVHGQLLAGDLHRVVCCPGGV